MRGRRILKSYSTIFICKVQVSRKNSFPRKHFYSLVKRGILCFTSSTVYAEYTVGRDSGFMEKDLKSESLMHDFRKQEQSSPMKGKLFLILGIAVLLGIGSGYFLVGQMGGQTSGSSTTTSDGKAVEEGTIIGSDDTETFKDIAQGKLEEGGIGDEGQYHLVRPGGESQNVYLTSSIVDLAPFVGKNIKVWGQTQAAQEAGWLMDVGRVEVLE